MRSAALVAVALALVVAGYASRAHALPRFAARAGRDCSLCHVNPSGGGPRNAFGRVFARTWLPWRATASPSVPTAGPSRAGFDPIGAFDGQLTEWLAVGADVRAAYLWVRPDRGIPPATRPEITSSFFLMQGALYADAALGPHVTMMLALNVYAGVEGWALARLRPEPSPWNLYLKAGRFMPPFGLRDVQHQLYTRGGIGFGNADRDTGLELGALLGPLSAQVALLNGTFGDAALDVHGSEATWFRKAIAARLALRMAAGPLRLTAGASFYYGGNGAQANPLFGGALPAAQAGDVAAGVDELRAGGFVAASLGRLAYQAELVVVRDSFVRSSVAPITGHASAQELSFVPVQGLDVLTTLEFRDRDVELTGDWSARLGFAVELFPFPFTELRLMVRREWSDVSATGGAWDFVGFIHLFP
ncbi:MAG: hypothetical protein IT379_22580 [Deltaproteobacteria bacterium]|nr:hypothetical protein [Deltaproteobacteria bacterium]